MIYVAIDYYRNHGVTHFSLLVRGNVCERADIHRFQTITCNAAYYYT